MVRVNGEEKDIAGISVADFLKNNGFNLTFIAVEINEEIVPKATFNDRIIADNDIIEIVNFVGGG